LGSLRNATTGGGQVKTFRVSG